MTAVALAQLPPWRSIWRSPRRAYRDLLVTRRLRPAILLAAGGGIAQALARGASHNIGLRTPLWTILILVPALGGVVGVIQLYVASAVLYWTGRLIAVPGSFRSVQVAVGWANIPWLLSLLLWVPGILIAGRHLFVEDPTAIQFATNARTLLSDLAWLLAGLGYLVSWVWSLVMLVNGLTVANNYSGGRAIFHLVLVATMLVAVALLIAPILLLAIRR